MRYYQFMLTMILTCCSCVLFVACVNPSPLMSDSDMQRQAIDERLEGWELGGLQHACDDCDFYMQEAIARKTAIPNKSGVGGSRSQTGVRVYLFNRVSIDKAFFMLLDSQFFAGKIDKNMKAALLQTILSNKNDFSQQNGIDEIGLYAYSSLSYAKRMRNDATLPRAMLDSVEIVQDQESSLHSTNSLEGFIVDGQIVILHYYGESNTWTRR